MLLMMHTNSDMIVWMVILALSPTLLFSQTLPVPSLPCTTSIESICIHDQQSLYQPWITGEYVYDDCQDTHAIFKNIYRLNHSITLSIHEAYSVSRANVSHFAITFERDPTAILSYCED
eukprot:73465_1